MTASHEVDYILHDCLFAVGQGVGIQSHIKHGAVVWLRTRYRDKFLHAMTSRGNSWERDRHRVTAVSRYLGQRALHHAQFGIVDVPAMAAAADEVERGCRMNEVRGGIAPEEHRDCTESPGSAF